MRKGRSETGFTLVEVLIVMVIMGMIGVAIGASLLSTINANQRVAKDLPGPRASQTLAAWLKTDIESASPSGLSTWISTVAGTASGCASPVPPEPLGTVNVLHVDTADPTGRASGPSDYSASYRYHPSDATLWRVWCRRGNAPIVNSPLVTQLKSVPSATYNGNTGRVSMTLITTAKSIDYTFSLSASSRTPSTTTVVPPDPTTTLVSSNACSYTAPVVTPNPVKKDSPGNSPGILLSALTFQVTASGRCSNPFDTPPDTGQMAVRFTVPPGGVTYTVPLQSVVAGVWKNTASYVSPSNQWKRDDVYPIVVLDGYDPADVLNSPGYPVPGPVFVLVVKP